jgi:predicted transcriptional regulator
MKKADFENKISGPNLVYMQTRNRLHVFSVVHQSLKKSGITNEELANRLGVSKDLIPQILGTPGDWTLDVVSDILAAIGKEISYSVVDIPFRE